MRKGVLTIWLVAMGIVAAGVYFNYFASGPNQNPGRDFNAAIPVQVASVGEVHFSDVLEAIGTARANESVDLTARVSETVQKVNFEDGQWAEVDWCWWS